MKGHEIVLQGVWVFKEAYNVLDEKEKVNSQVITSVV